MNDPKRFQVLNCSSSYPQPMYLAGLLLIDGLLPAFPDADKLQHVYIKRFANKNVSHLTDRKTFFAMFKAVSTNILTNY